MKTILQLSLFFLLPFTAFSAEPNFEGVCVLKVTPLKTKSTFNLQPCGFKAEFTDDELKILSKTWVIEKTYSRTPTYDVVPNPNNPLYDKSLHAQDDSYGCEFIGDYKRSIVKTSDLQTRCGGGAPEVVLCQATIYCRSGSAIHKEHNLGDGDFEGDVTCLAKDRQCPSLAACASDEAYAQYQGGSSKVVDELKDQSTSTGR